MMLVGSDITNGVMQRRSDACVGALEQDNSWAVFIDGPFLFAIARLV